MYQRKIKRLIDFILSLLLMPFFLILLLIVWILIKFDDNGPVFYNANRLGEHGEIFKMYKFRSMKVNAPDLRNEDGSTFNSENDPRLTKIGGFIRKTSIDEVPQLINVLIGDMSFVGPRPDLPEHINQYSEMEKIKLNVKPGITGYNQAYFRNSIPWKKRLKNDVFYVENISFMIDLKIIFKTIMSVLANDNVFVEEKNEE